MAYSADAENSSEIKSRGAIQRRRGRKSFSIMACRTIFSKNTKIGAENPDLGKFMGEIENLSTHNLYSRQTVGHLQLSVGKSQLSAPTFNPRQAAVAPVDRMESAPMSERGAGT